MLVPVTPCLPSETFSSICYNPSFSSALWAVFIVSRNILHLCHLLLLVHLRTSVHPEVNQNSRSPAGQDLFRGAFAFAK